jgi:hypothetical protein
MQGIQIESFIAKNAGGEKGFLVLTFGIIWGILWLKGRSKAKRNFVRDP